MSSHKRNTVPMLESPRCGARTRRGTSCRSPAVRGKTRCRMHGGATGSGAPIGNQNARKHGTYTKAAFAQRAQVREIIKAVPTLFDKEGTT
jgi:glucans biosynthesis protein